MAVSSNNQLSWLYEVKIGATTMWETWNSIMEDGTPTHESYNHYAFGCTATASVMGWSIASYTLLFAT